MKIISGLLFTIIYSHTVFAAAPSPSVIPPVLSILLDESKPINPPTDPAWGARRLQASDRPKTGWVDNFNNITPIDVPAVAPTVEEALNRCATEYCIVRIDQLRLRDTVYLDRPKTKLLGANGNKITYADNVGETGAFFEIENGANQILLEGLNLDGESHAYGNKVVFGVMVYGQDIDKIIIRNNEIHGLNSNEDAHGIAVYGTGGSDHNAIRNIEIAGNKVHHMRTGSSESIVINGNVRNWQISHNTVHQVNNIAIDAIGGEGTSPVRVLNGRTLPGLFDAARVGFIEGNTVTDMTTLDNPAYGREHSWAGAIYVDGAQDLMIRNNTVSNAEWAYDIGAENCVTPNNIVLENNIASGSYYGDFLLGGYATQGFREHPSIECNPLKSNDNREGHGYVEKVTIKGNQFNTVTPVEDEGTINLQYRIRHSIIIQPGLGVQEVHRDGVVSGDENSIRISE